VRNELAKVTVALLIGESVKAGKGTGLYGKGLHPQSITSPPVCAPIEMCSGETSFYLTV
jgi:hypothetical protein